MVDIAVQMAAILGGACACLGLLSLTLTRSGAGSWLPTAHASKRAFEEFCLAYTAVWIFLFGGIVVTQAYEWFDERHYMVVCVGLSLPFLLQPLVWPGASREAGVPLLQRYSFRANVWIAIFSFIGNYWYTHYFYNVLKASYLFPSWRLNDVPLALYFATHFYFCTYFTFSNLLLRKVETRYRAGPARTIFFWAVVVVFSYFTAFMETLTISSFPYYTFQDRNMAYALGSMYYGLYFIVAFPVFKRIDEGVERHALFRVVFDALGSGMFVLILLDVVRLWLGERLAIDGKLWYLYR